MCLVRGVAAHSGRSLKANAAWSVLGNLIYTGGRILIVVFLTRTFSSEQVGQVIFALAVVTPLSYLVNMELRSVFVTNPQGRIKLGHCLANRLISNVVFIAVLVGICVWAWDIWGGYKSAVVLTAGLVRGAESWADVYMGAFQKCEQLKRWAISQALKTAGVLGWVIFLPSWTDDIIWMLVGWWVATLLVAWFYDRTRARQLMSVRPLWDAKISGELTRWGFSLGVFVTLAILNHQVGQYFIEHALGDSAVAYFGVLVMYVSGATTLQNGVNQAVLPRLARYFVEDRKQFRGLLSKVLGASWLVMLISLAIVGYKGQELLRLVHGAEYAPYASLFFLMMLAGCFLLTAMILGDAVVACRRYKSRMAAVALGLGINILICASFIGRYGLPAAAWATLASALATCLVCAAVLIHTARLKGI